MFLGSPPYPTTMFIPPRSNKYTLASYCPEQCTNYLPKEGITIIAGFLHTHLAGEISMDFLKFESF